MVFDKVNLAIVLNILVLLLLGLRYSSNNKAYNNKKFKIISITTSFICTGIVAILPI